ncbi:MAG: cysteine desulfurase family protein [Candidatus Pacearchaeota archaeon]
MKIYADNAATTPIDKVVLKEIMKYSKFYANPSSKHELGEEARKIIEKARLKIASFINAKENEIIFTSGGSEGNNFIIKGLARRYSNKKHILISSIEHPSVIEPAISLEKEGFIIEKIKVDKEGILDLEDLKSKIRDDTLLVSVMHVNNEIGTIQPIEEVAKICREKKIFFHSDMVQSFKKINIDVKKIGIDFATFSGHKINAPKGIGFVYIKEGNQIEPLIHGGGQERNLRSGTENVLGIVALAKAIEIKKDIEKIKEQRDFIIKELLKIEGTRLNGSLKKRVYNNINVSFYGIEGESLLLLLSRKGIYVSTGSACSSHKLAESHVLKAIGVEPLYLNGSIRITLDLLTKKEIFYLIEKIKESVEYLRSISPFKLEKEVK